MVTPDQIRVVLGDANVLYSRVLRDYLLYAADEEVISIAWSARVLDEVTEHLIENRPDFTAESGARLVAAMNTAYPYAEVEPTEAHYRRVEALVLPDEDDRHVLAAAVAAEANVLCTANVKDFPAAATSQLGIETSTPDELLVVLISEFEQQMLAVHATTVASLRGATDESTIAALERAGAPRAAALMARLLGLG